MPQINRARPSARFFVDALTTLYLEKGSDQPTVATDPASFRTRVNNSIRILECARDDGLLTLETLDGLIARLLLVRLHLYNGWARNRYARRTQCSHGAF